VTPTIYKTELEQELIAKVAPALEPLGYELRDLEFFRGSSTIRVTLDFPNGVGQIGVEDCSRAHQILGPLFDVWDPISGAYTLELSSPGEKPNLRTLRHFEEAKGQTIKLQTVDALPVPPPAKPRKNWEGILESVEASGSFILKDDVGSYTLNMKQVKTAVWLREWTVSDEKGMEN